MTSKPIRPHTVSPIRPVPASIPRPEYVGQPGPLPYRGSEIQSDEVIEAMRVAGKIAAGAKFAAGEAVRPGVTTDELDRIAHEYLLDHHAYPSCLGYRGFPKSICTSVNEVICHGIPDSRPLEDGDLVKIDVTAYIGGVHGDNCGTFFCGDVSDDAKLLAERTETAMMRAIKAAQPGREINVIGRVIESYAKRFGYGVVKEYTGHGVHTVFHSGLVIPHYEDLRYDTVIQPGMTFTIEPMLTMFGDASSHVWEDGWTVVTNNGAWCAQYEHTILITDDGAEILTLP